MREDQHQDLIYEKALDWLDGSIDDVCIPEKKEIILELFKSFAMLQYLMFSFRDPPPGMSSSELVGYKKQIESDFPNDVRVLNLNPEHHEKMFAYYSGIVNGVSKVVKWKSGYPIITMEPTFLKSHPGQDLQETQEDQEDQDSDTSDNP